MERITIFLEPMEKDALLILANKEYRDPRYQAALIIREDLARRGLLPQEQPTEPDPSRDDARKKVSRL
jgi:hypothetical protein